MAVETTAPNPSLISWTHWMYLLHAVSAASGLFGPAMVVTAFLFGWPSIIAMIMNYIKKGEAGGSWLESHFTYQRKTFWTALIAYLLIGLFSAPLVLLLGLGIFTWWLGAIVVGIWVIYRVIRGWLRLKDGQPI